MEPAVKRIAITGAAGQIAYSLLFRIASGELFGSKQSIALSLVEVEGAIAAAEGVRLELEDGAYPLLHSITVTSDPYKAFADAELAILVGARPRGPGMERGELLAENAKIFVEQGKALDTVAKDTVRVLVVGNPCNTNCLLAIRQCRRLTPSSFHAMTRLDENRAKALLARRAGVEVAAVSDVTIWGNHSSTQVPDPFNAKIGGRPAPEVIGDREWLEGSYMREVQQRGATIIAARGKSSAASAAQAILDDLRSLYTTTESGSWYSMAVYSKGNPYNIDDDLVFSFPCRTHSDGTVSIVADVPWTDDIRAKIALSEAELIEERSLTINSSL